MMIENRHSHQRMKKLNNEYYLTEILQNNETYPFQLCENSLVIVSTLFRSLHISIKRFVDNRAASYQQKSLHESGYVFISFVFSQPTSTFEHTNCRIIVIRTTF